MRQKHSLTETDSQPCPAVGFERARNVSLLVSVGLSSVYLLHSTPPYSTPLFQPVSISNCLSSFPPSVIVLSRSVQSIFCRPTSPLLSGSDHPFSVTLVRAGIIQAIVAAGRSTPRDRLFVHRLGQILLGSICEFPCCKEGFPLQI